MQSFQLNVSHKTDDTFNENFLYNDFVFIVYHTKKYDNPC